MIEAQTSTAINKAVLNEEAHLSDYNIQGQGHPLAGPGNCGNRRRGPARWQAARA